MTERKKDMELIKLEEVHINKLTKIMENVNKCGFHIIKIDNPKNRL